MRAAAGLLAFGLALAASAAEPAPLPFADDAGLWGYVDRTGKVVVEPKYQRATGFREGLASVLMDGKWGFIDPSGKEVIAPTFPEGDLIGPEFSEGLVVLAGKGKWGKISYGYADKTGVMVIPAKFQHPGDFREGLAYVDRAKFIDKTGKVALEGGHLAMSDFSEGLTPAEASENHYGYRDRKGTYVIKPRFKNAFSFHEGLAKVWLSDADGGGAAYIDKTGKIALKPEGGDTGPFSDGLATLTLPATFAENRDRTFGYGYMDHTGKTVIPATFYEAQDFSEGLAGVARLVKVNSCYRKEKAWGFIDASGKVVVEQKYMKVEPFHDGAARVTTTDDAWGWIDKTGRTIWLSKPSGRPYDPCVWGDES